MNGGIFDGALGVMGALEVVRELNEDMVRTRRPIAVIVFTDEEGNAYTPFLGSKYFAGLLRPTDLEGFRGLYSGNPFPKDFEEFSKRTKATRIDRFVGNVAHHVELHVEQGPVLESMGKEIGVVTGIVGVQRLWITFKGRQSHAGTTPMNMRRDPMIPAARTILAVRRETKKVEEAVGTVGLLDVTPNVMNVISGQVTVGVDIRSLEAEDMKAIKEAVLNEATEAAAEEKVQVGYKELFEEPVKCSEEVVSKIESSAKKLGLSYMRMPSRALHDTQVMASVAKVGMIFVPSKGGVSHAPDEYTDWEQVEKGVKLLKEVIMELSD